MSAVVRSFSLSVLALCALASLSAPTRLLAQAPEVPVYKEGKGNSSQAAITAKAIALKEQGVLLSLEKVKEQMKRETCTLQLPAPRKEKLENRDLWRQARQSHLRIGWHYQCTKCNRWHLNLAGGYAITSEAVVTCGHVLVNEDIREGYLIAVDEDDQVIPVAEVLATNLSTDTAIIRLGRGGLHPLPLTLDVVPGDRAFCFSDPLGRRGFFSEGMVNRFTQRPFNQKKRVPPAPAPANPDGTNPTPNSADAPPPPEPSAAENAPQGEFPVWIQVSTDWAPGSSGSAVLDAHGNAMGHVSEIQTLQQDGKTADGRNRSAPVGTMLVLHDAIAAKNVLELIKQP